MLHVSHQNTASTPEEIDLEEIKSEISNYTQRFFYIYRYPHTQIYSLQKWDHIINAINLSFGLIHQKKDFHEIGTLQNDENKL